MSSVCDLNVVNDEIHFIFFYPKYFNLKEQIFDTTDLKCVSLNSRTQNSEPFYLTSVNTIHL